MEGLPPFVGAPRPGPSGERGSLLLAGVVQLAIRLVEIAMERPALVVVQTVPALVAAAAPLGSLLAALPAPVVPALLGLRDEVESRVTPASVRRRSREDSRECKRSDQCLHVVQNRL